ncbi:MAG: hypothetical protein VX396_04340 [SAR324 cluster bacterium]|nr:hypothetical protein [SAR324 cluster bacterium]
MPQRILQALLIRRGIHSSGFGNVSTPWSAEDPTEDGVRSREEQNCCAPHVASMH